MDHLNSTAAQGFFEKDKISGLRDLVFAQKNDHCFIERERFLNARPISDEHPTDFYATLLSDMLDSVSTPIEPDDIFVGRVIEGAPLAQWRECPNRTLFAKGQNHSHTAITSPSSTPSAKPITVSSTVTSI